MPLVYRHKNKKNKTTKTFKQKFNQITFEFLQRQILIFKLTFVSLVLTCVDSLKFIDGVLTFAYPHSFTHTLSTRIEILPLKLSYASAVHTYTHRPAPFTISLLLIINMKHIKNNEFQIFNFNSLRTFTLAKHI